MGTSWYGDDLVWGELVWGRFGLGTSWYGDDLVGGKLVWGQVGLGTTWYEASWYGASWYWGELVTGRVCVVLGLVFGRVVLRTSWLSLKLLWNMIYEIGHFIYKTDYKNTKYEK